MEQAEWPKPMLAIAADDIRTDRILDEVDATAGVVHRVSDLFGLSIDAATRYATVLDHPGLGRDDSGTVIGG